MLRATYPYPPLTGDMIRRGSGAWEPDELTVRLARRGALAQNARLFAATWAGGFVFFLALLG